MVQLHAQFAAQEKNSSARLDLQQALDAALADNRALVARVAALTRELGEERSGAQWARLIGHVSEYSTAKALRSRVTKHAGNQLQMFGVPKKQRPEVWELMCGALDARKSNEGVYAACVADCKRLLDKGVAEEIRKDVVRTKIAGERSEDMSAAMTRVLSVFALRHPKIGYCQSMNLLVKPLLAVFGPDQGEERVFWVLEALVTKLLPAGYYTAGMEGIRAECVVVRHLVKK